jgi:hypothetical protein
MMEDVTVYQDKPLSIASVKEQINLIQQLMKDVMRENEHFGIIPGCKNPSLLKAGAEKILFIFHLVADISGDDVPYDLGNGHREYRIKVKLFNSRGELRGVGVGSCSTMETKFRYRTGPVELTDTVIPKEYWDLRKSDPGKAQAIIGKGYVPKKNEAGVWVAAIQGERVEHDNPADYYNTCLKVAHKRAKVSATLATTAASDIFTQDVEDMVENGEKFDQKKAAFSSTLKKPQEKTPASENSLKQKFLAAMDELTALSGGDPIAMLKDFSSFEGTDNDGNKVIRCADSIDKLFKPNKDGKTPWAQSTYGKIKTAIQEYKTSQAMKEEQVEK